MNDTAIKLGQTYPNIVLFFIAYSLYQNNLRILFFTICCVVTLLGNVILKHISNKLLPKTSKLLGRVNRPIGAKNCGVLGDYASPIVEHHIGMPSGHSQLAWMVCGYALLNIWEGELNLVSKKTKTKEEYIYYSILSVLFVLISFGVSISRVEMHCHTPQQVLIGGLIGIVSAYGFYKLRYYFNIKNDDKIVN
jgi:membrane-associated phospholipid phosphatase